MCSQTWCYDKCETISINVFYDNICALINVRLFDGWKQAQTVFLAILVFLPCFKLMKNETELWKSFFWQALLNCLTLLFATCSLKSVSDVKIKEILFCHYPYNFRRVAKDNFLLLICLSKIFLTLIKVLQNWNCIIMVTNSLKERKIDSF